jgi:hypothetical protein
MLSFLLKDCSPSDIPAGCSSPMVLNILSVGLKADGDCVEGSGDVPHDELSPAFDPTFEEADGEL